MPQQQHAALVETRGQTLFTMSALAREFQLDRATVKRHLEGIEPAGQVVGGHDGWTLDAVAVMRAKVDAAREPEQKVRAYDQDKFYAAQLKRLQFEREMKQVVPAAEAQAQWREFVKRLVAWVDSLADQLERAAGLTPTQVEQLERRIDEMRGDLHAEVTRGDDAGAG
jgi:hypothetical protein